MGLIGYSGGSIAFVWAAQLAPSYAPDISGQLVAAATGGIPVDIVNTLNYIDGAPFWGPMTVMILIGMSRAYGFSLDPYLSDYGKRMIHDLDKASIPELVDASNNTNPLFAPDPAVPVYVGQAANGTLTGTPDGPEGIGPGDGITVVGDTRALAHKYCSAGVPVTYEEYGILEHSVGFVYWFNQAWPGLRDRLEGNPATPAAAVPPAAPGELASLRDGLRGSSQGSSG